MTESLLKVDLVMRGMDHSPALEEFVKDKAQKLLQHAHQVTACRVTLERTQNRQHQGKLHCAHFHIDVPGHEVVVKSHELEDIYQAISEGVAAGARRLDRIFDKMQGQVKTHALPIMGEVDRIFADDAFGFILGADQQEYYFNKDSLVHHDFTKIAPGLAVQFVPAEGYEGPVAHKVVIKKGV